MTGARISDMTEGTSVRTDVPSLIPAAVIDTALSGNARNHNFDLRGHVRVALNGTNSKALFDQAANATFERLGNTTSGSAVITGLRTTSDLSAGATVTHGNFAVGTTILSIDSASQVTMSASSSATTTGANLQWTTPVNAAYVAANSRSSFRDSDGTAFILSKEQVVTLPMFGAIHDRTFATDSSTAIQEGLWWMIEHKPDIADITLDSGFSASIYFGPSISPDNTISRNIIGDLRLVRIAGGTGLLRCFTIRNLGHVNGQFKVRVTGLGGTTFSSRLDANAIVVENCERAIIPALRGDNAWWGGVVFATASNNSVTVRNVWNNNIGSGHSQTATHSLSGNWSNPTDSGSSGSAGQRTTLTLDTMMPYAEGTTIESFMKVTETATFLRINNFLYQVMSVDAGAGTVQIYPWIDSTLGASGTYTWVFGGGIVFRSGDGLVDIDTHHALRCGIGANLVAQYGGHYKGGVATTCGIGVCIGREAGGNVNAGGSAFMPYFEGSTVIEHLVFTGLSGSQYSYIFGEHNLDIARVWVLGYPRDGSNNIVGGEVGVFGTGGTFIAQHLISHRGRLLQFERRNISNNPDGLDVFRDQQTFHRIRTLQGVDSRTVTIEKIGTGEFNRLFGYRGSIWGFIGSGADGQPTGTITFAPPSGGTINGGAVDATVAYTGFSGPVYFEILHTDTAQLTWKVRPIIGWRMTGSKTWNPGNIADTDQETTTVTVTGAALGDAFVPSFSLDLQGLLLTAYTSATNTVTVVLANLTGGAVNLDSGTLTVRKVN